MPVNIKTKKKDKEKWSYKLIFYNIVFYGSDIKQWMKYTFSRKTLKMKLINIISIIIKFKN